MKIRNGYVSNSSSSSFLIAYDKNFFGDLFKLFKEACFGETKVELEFDTFFEYCCDEDDFENDKEKYSKLIEEKQNEGKEVIYLYLDHDFGDVLDIFKQINEKNGNNKIEFLYKDWM